MDNVADISTQLLAVKVMETALHGALAMDDIQEAKDVVKFAIHGTKYDATLINCLRIVFQESLVKLSDDKDSILYKACYDIVTDYKLWAESYLTNVTSAMINGFDLV